MLWILIGAAIIALFVLLYKKGDKIERWFFGLFKPKRKKVPKKETVRGDESAADGRAESETEKKSPPTRGSVAKTEKKA